MQRLQGKFLIASPHLTDGNFFQSVVLIIQHDDQGAMGLVVNHPTGRTVREMWELITDTPCDCEAKIFLGGPVRGPLAAVHRREELANREIAENMYFTGDEELVSEIIGSCDAASCRLFIGYSGWAPGQLESELEIGGWIIVEAQPDDVFSDPELLWKSLLRRIGDDFITSTIKTRHVPSSPNLN